jgi:hypothetical protein
LAVGLAFIVLFTCLFSSNPELGVAEVMAATEARGQICNACPFLGISAGIDRSAEKFHV